MKAKSSISGLVLGMGAVTAFALAGCSGVDGSQADNVDEVSVGTQQALEIAGVAPDQFCKASDRNVQLDLTGVALTRVPGTRVTGGTPGADNVEGPTWHKGAIYYSNINNATNAGVIWKLIPGSTAEKFLDDAGTNGLGVSFNNKLLGARQLNGSITEFKWNHPANNPKTVVGTYNGKRFNAPNDLTISRSGRVYFTDPLWNVPAGTDPSTIQGGGPLGDTSDGQRVYRVDGEGEAVALNVGVNLRDRPNGIMLGLDESYIIIGGARGVYRFDLSPAGETSNEQRLFPPTNEEAVAIQGPTDGMARDCAGNIYVTAAGGGGGVRLLVFSPQMQLLGAIPVPLVDWATNATFGGPDGKTLYVSVASFGGAEPAGLFSARLNVSGYPQ